MHIDPPHHIELYMGWLKSIYSSKDFCDHLIEWGNLLFNGSPEFCRDFLEQDQELAAWQYWAAIENMYHFERALTAEYNY